MKVRFLTIFAVIMLTLVGCNANTNDNQEGQADDMNKIEPTRYNTNDNRNDTNRNTRDYTMDRNRNDEGRENRGLNREDRDRKDNNQQYEVAEKAADRITDKVKGVDHAYVLTTNNNAYVAATMDNDHRDNNNRNDTKKNDRNDGNVGHHNNNRNDGKNRDRNNNDGGMNTHHTGDDLTDDVKNEITDIVKSVDNNIDNVYVSTNPDFFDLTNNYVDDMNNGKPVRGFFDQFGNMIERLFPQNKNR